MRRFIALFAIPLAVVPAHLLFGFGEPPRALLVFELFIFSVCALGYGFGFRLRFGTGLLNEILTSRPLIGAALLTGGVLAPWMNAELIVSGLLLGAGIRQVWLAACSLEPPPAKAGNGTAVTLAGEGSRNLSTIRERTEIETTGGGKRW